MASADGFWEESACGKVILLGEHAVVYGVPALCGALAEGATVKAVPGTGRLRVPAWGVVTAPWFATDGTTESESSPTLSKAFSAVVKQVFAQAQQTPAQDALPFDFEVRFSIPTSAGLGSSAAMSVALVRAVCRVLSLSLSEAQLDACALAAETVFHGSPSGLDHTLARQGGMGLFRRAVGLTPLADVPTLRLCIANTGKARDTRGRVARVKELVDEAPERTRRVFADIERWVIRAVEALAARDFLALGAAMNENQRLLAELEVSCPEIEAACAVAKAAGALGAKLTGGGGGGCVIALAAPEREEAVLAAWRKAGFPCFVTDIRPGQVHEQKPARTRTDAAVKAVATANTNIALVKYWGKNDTALNLPAVPSLSLTLAGLTTVTDVTLDPRLPEDELHLNGQRTDGPRLRKVTEHLDLLARELRRFPRPRANVVTHNNFPTAAGLASSASAFAALTVAGYGALVGETALALPLDRTRLSIWARQGSGSAARSLFGGLSVLCVGTPGQVDSAFAQGLLSPHAWPELRLVIGIVSDEEKATSSTSGMTHTAKTSPYFAPFVAAAPHDLEAASHAIAARNVQALGQVVERSALRMHACAMAADPAVVYLRGPTLEGFFAISALRKQGIEAYFTCDAGPHPKAITTAKHAQQVAAALANVPGVRRTQIAEPGEGAALLSVETLP
jgi:diphosphomevalonate decarboxylase